MLSDLRSVQSFSHVWFCYPMDCSMPGLPVHHQLRNLPKLRSIESVMPSNLLILCRPLLLLPSIFPSIMVFSSESALRIRWQKYWSFSFSIGPSSEHSGLTSFRMDWLDLLAVPHSQQLSVIWLLTLWPSTRWQHVPELGPSVTGYGPWLRFPEVFSRDWF